MSPTGRVELTVDAALLDSEEIELAERWEVAHEPLTANGGRTLTDPDLGVLAHRLYGLTHPWRVQVEPRRDPKRDPYTPLTAQAAIQPVGSHSERLRFGRSQTHMRRIRGIGRIPYHPLTHHDPGLDVQLCYAPAVQEPSSGQDGEGVIAAAKRQYRKMTAHGLPMQPELSAHSMEGTIISLRGPFLPMTLLYGGFPPMPEGAELPAEWAQARAQWKNRIAQLGISDSEMPEARKWTSNYWMLRCGTAQRESESLLREIVQGIVPDDNAAAANVVLFPAVGRAATSAAAHSSAPVHYASTGPARAHRGHRLCISQCAP